MRYVGTLLALAAMGAGLRAALKWYEASRVEVQLSPDIHVPDLDAQGHIVATWNALSESAALNKTAALWPAASVMLSAMSALAGAFG